MYYAEINFKKKNEEETDYAEVFCSSSLKDNTGESHWFPNEKIYRLIKDYCPLENKKKLLKKGDIILSLKEENGFVFGKAFHVSQQSKFFEVVIPIEHLLLFIPDQTIPTPADPFALSNQSSIYDNVATEPIYSIPNKEKDSLTSFYQEGKSAVTNVTSIKKEKTDLDLLFDLAKTSLEVFSKESHKNISKQILASYIIPNSIEKYKLEESKIPKKIKISKRPIKPQDNELQVISLCEFKNKKKDLLKFKQFQFGILFYVTNCGNWWLVKIDKGTLGWVPSSYWRLFYIERENEMMKEKFEPWIIDNVDKKKSVEFLSDYGRDKNFLVSINPLKSEQATLCYKLDNLIYHYQITVNKDDVLLHNHKFQSLHNLIIYFMKNPLNIDNPKSVIGKPLMMPSL